ncbi:MAG: glycosyltransferase family protein [Rikenellaceae bacterium]
MRYIFVIQGEGRGHLTQALSLGDMLRRNGHEVSEVLVGRCKNRELPKFFSDKIDAPITQFDSPTFDYGQSGKRGRVLKTIFNNTTPVKMNKWRKSVNIIAKKINQSNCDVVVNFYEFLLGAAVMIHNLEKPIICIGHQFMIDHPRFKQSPSEGGTLMLRLNNHICSYGAHKRLALSFYPMKRALSRHIEVVPPLLRPEIYSLKSTTEGFVLGYILNPAYLSEIMVWKSQNPDTEVHLFWDKIGAAECEEKLPGLWLHKINDKLFLEMMAKCRGYVTTAGFESICEAMYLGKPVVMIPAHVEQQINAADAHSVGAGEISDEFNLTLLESAIANYSADTESFRKWVDSAEEHMLRALTEI